MKERAAELKRTRKAGGWTQAQAAARLGLSQGYTSLLESGKRRVPERLLPRPRRELGLSATALPAREFNLDPGSLPGALAALGYEPFGYLRGRYHNPAELLLAALRQSDLPARVVEGLPWLVLRHRDLDWKWLVEHAKVHDVQNRLAYVVALAREVAEGRYDVRLAARFQKLLADMERSRLAASSEGEESTQASTARGETSRRGGGHSRRRRRSSTRRSTRASSR